MFGSKMSLPAGMNQCADFMMFQSALKELRSIDDKIVYALNNSIPTASFKGQVDAKETCKDLHNQILSTYDIREGALTACINYAQEQVTKAAETSNSSARRQAQMHLRLYKNEMSVEEVIRERTQTICYEKCRDHFPDMKFKKVL